MSSASYYFNFFPEQSCLSKKKKKSAIVIYPFSGERNFPGLISHSIQLVLPISFGLGKCGTLDGEGGINPFWPRGFGTQTLSKPLWEHGIKQALLPSEGQAAWWRAARSTGLARRPEHARSPSPERPRWGARGWPWIPTPEGLVLDPPPPHPGRRHPQPPAFPRATAYSLRKSLSWRLNLSRSSAELRCPKSSGAGGSKPRGSENIVHGLRLARRAGFRGGAHGGRRLRGRRRLWCASGSRHFPGRARLLRAELSFLEMPEMDRARSRGRPRKRAGAEVTSPQTGVWRAFAGCVSFAFLAFPLRFEKVWDSHSKDLLTHF